MATDCEPSPDPSPQASPTDVLSHLTVGVEVGVAVAAYTAAAYNAECSTLSVVEHRGVEHLSLIHI